MNGDTMRNCEEITKLLSKRQDTSLSLPERIELSLHLGMCAGCRNYAKNILFLSQACQSLRDMDTSREKT